jgi:hypothetical protein
MEEGECQTHTAMSNKLIATIATMGVDIGKNPFHVADFILIGMEASVGPHHRAQARVTRD